MMHQVTHLKMSGVDVFLYHWIHSVFRPIYTSTSIFLHQAAPVNICKYMLLTEGHEGIASSFLPSDTFFSYLLSDLWLDTFLTGWGIKT